MEVMRGMLWGFWGDLLWIIVGEGTSVKEAWGLRRKRAWRLRIWLKVGRAGVNVWSRCGFERRFRRMVRVCGTGGMLESGWVGV